MLWTREKYLCERWQSKQVRVAVLGPVCRDEVVIDGKKHTNMGGIPYYVGKALQALGVSCTLFVTHAEEDREWVREQLKGLDVVHIFSEKTLCFRLRYSSENPDKRVHETVYAANRISPEDVVHLIEGFDYIIMGPLFYGDIDDRLFELLGHKRIVLGNFGMFNYAEGGMMVKRHPERAMAVMPHVKYLFLDEEEAMFVAQKESVPEAVGVLQRRVENVVVTMGSKGSELFLGKKHLCIAAFPPRRIVDPTGAGDVFLAAFIAGLELFDDPQRVGSFAAMAATVSIESKGSLRCSREELFQRLGWKE